MTFILHLPFLNKRN